MDVNELIDNLRFPSWHDLEDPDATLLADAADALSTLQGENEKMRAENNMLRRVQPVELNGEAARSLSLALEASQLRAELEQVKAEKAKAIENLSDNLRIAYQSRDAAVEDMTEIIGDIEKIRREYDVDNADADEAFAELCNGYCANAGNLCYEEGEHYRCKHFKWRGPQKGE